MFIYSNNTLTLGHLSDPTASPVLGNVSNVPLSPRVHNAHLSLTTFPSLATRVKRKAITKQQASVLAYHIPLSPLEFMKRNKDSATRSRGDMQYNK